MTKNAVVVTPEFNMLGVNIFIHVHHSDSFKLIHLKGIEGGYLEACGECFKEKQAVQMRMDKYGSLQEVKE